MQMSFGTGKRKVELAAVILADPVVNCMPTWSLCTFLDVRNIIQVFYHCFSYVCWTCIWKVHRIQKIVKYIMIEEYNYVTGYVFTRVE